MVSNKELRAKARQNLGGGIFQNAWLMTLVALLVGGVILGVGDIVPGAVLILCGPIEYGIARMLLNTSRTGDANLNKLFDGFKEDIGNVIILGVLKTIFVFLWSLLFVIPGIIKSYSYALSAFIQQDEENKNWKYCIDKSREMMAGKKMKLFLLDLSFIGWYLLGILCLGIGVLFVEPYHYQARAEFYEDIKGTAEIPATEDLKIEG